VRWKIIWGLGVGIELHGGYGWATDGSGGAPVATAALALHYEL
jgi:hypothetical protein